MHRRLSHRRTQLARVNSGRLLQCCPQLIFVTEITAAIFRFKSGYFTKLSTSSSASHREQSNNREVRAAVHLHCCWTPCCFHFDKTPRLHCTTSQLIIIIITHVAGRRKEIEFKNVCCGTISSYIDGVLKEKQKSHERLSF